MIRRTALGAHYIGLLSDMTTGLPYGLGQMYGKYGYVANGSGMGCANLQRLLRCVLNLARHYVAFTSHMDVAFTINMTLSHMDSPKKAKHMMYHLTAGLFVHPETKRDIKVTRHERYPGY